MLRIVLATLNARYSHTSFGLRCLLANLGPYRDGTILREFTIGQPPDAGRTGRSRTLS